MPASSFQQQKLRVCEVCSAYLGLHDNDRRLADHFGGKLHLGFIEIREKLDRLRVSGVFDIAYTALISIVISQQGSREATQCKCKPCTHPFCEIRQWLSFQACFIGKQQAIMLSCTERSRSLVSIFQLFYVSP